MRALALSLLIVSGCASSSPSGRVLTDDEGVEDYPAFAPGGRRVAYAASSTGDLFGGNWDLWLLDLETGERERLTMHPGDDRFPSFHPSGDEIGFWSDREGGGYYRAALGGGEPRRIGAAPSFASGPPVWMSDGERIALVVRSEDGVALEIVSASSGETLRDIPLAGESTRRFDVSASPDGRFFAFVDASSLTAHVTRIHVLDVEGGESVAVTDGLSNDWSPSWSPDGESLYFVSNRGGKKDVWRQPMNGGRPAGGPEAVTRDVGVRRAALSPDGAMLIVSRGQTVANVWRVPRIEDRPARWEDAEPVTSGDAYVEFISLSPDGASLATTSDAYGNPDLWRVDVESGRSEPLTDDPAPDWGPSWSPDGERIAFYAYRSGNRDLWVMPSAGGPATQLTDDPAADMYPAWSPDGERLVFYSVRSGNRDLWVMPAAGGEARQLTREPGDDLFPVWSPDGGRIAFFSDRDGTGRIWTIDPDTEEAAPVRAGPGRFPRFAPGGRRLLFTGWAERLGNVFEVDLGSGEERQLTDLEGRPGNLGSYALATDGRFVYFTWESNEGDLVAYDAIP